MRRREFIAFLGGAVAFGPVGTRALQSPNKIPRVGIIANELLEPIRRFLRRLQDLGYVEGKNLLIEARFAEGDYARYAKFAEDLAALAVDLIVVWGTPAALATKKAAAKIPIVAVVGDVLHTGIASNLTHPDENITGFVALNVDLGGKRLEMLKEIIPSLSRVAILGNSVNPLTRI
jgi:putative tryptophan/tyrosine transport system substrate-binding protein